MGTSLAYGILRFVKAVYVDGGWIRMIQKDRNGSESPELAHFPARHAVAWKLLHKAGKRGGDTSVR